MMVRKLIIVSLLFALCLSASVAAGNYVNWKGEFWLQMPEGWDKVEYREVDQILMTMDTASDVFKYEAVLAPKDSKPFTSGPYMFITFEPSGELSDAAADSVLRSIAASYANDILESPDAGRLSDLNPGQPRLNLKDRTVQVLSDLAFSKTQTSKLWLYLKLNQKGLIAFYMYCPEAQFEEAKPQFEAMINSLKFDGLREAAGGESGTFTDVKGGKSSGGAVSKAEEEITEGFVAYKNLIYIFIGIVILAGIIWSVVIVPRRKKHKEENGSD